MIKTYPFETLGGADHGWLKTKFHFSFADYDNPERVHFGELRVINDDRIAPGKGFGEHPHNNMEIITYVREGAISHRDNLGNMGRTSAGNIQVMSAGWGVEHSEANLEKTDCVLFQIWIMPNRKNVEPRWEAKEFPQMPAKGALPLLVSGRPEDKGKGALLIYQDAAIYGGNLKEGTIISQPIKHQAYVVVSKGSVEIDGKMLKQGDGAEVTEEKEISIKAKTDAEILIIDVP